MYANGYYAALLHGIEDRLLNAEFSDEERKAVLEEVNQISVGVNHAINERNKDYSWCMEVARGDIKDIADVTIAIQKLQRMGDYREAKRYYQTCVQIRRDYNKYGELPSKVFDSTGVKQTYFSDRFSDEQILKAIIGVVAFIVGIALAMLEDC